MEVVESITSEGGARTWILCDFVTVYACRTCFEAAATASTSEGCLLHGVECEGDVTIACEEGHMLCERGAQQFCTLEDGAQACIVCTAGAYTDNLSNLLVKRALVYTRQLRLAAGVLTADDTEVGQQATWASEFYTGNYNDDPPGVDPATATATADPATASVDPARVDPANVGATNADAATSADETDLRPMDVDGSSLHVLVGFLEQHPYLTLGGTAVRPRGQALDGLATLLSIPICAFVTEPALEPIRAALRTVYGIQIEGDERDPLTVSSRR